jgi:hypothetical protein
VYISAEHNRTEQVMGESEGSSINKTESPQLQSLLDPVPEELSPVVEKESDTQSNISISQEPTQQAISTLDDQSMSLTFLFVFFCLLEINFKYF